MKHTIVLTIAGMCNLNCHYCDLSFEKSFISLDHIKEILEKHKGLHSDDPYVIISGGEPTLHPQFIEIVKYVQDQGYKGQIITNGHRILEYIKDITLSINLSLSSMKFNNFIEKDYKTWSILPDIIRQHPRGAEGVTLSIVFNNDAQDMKSLLDFCLINNLNVTVNIPTIIPQGTKAFYHSANYEINKTKLKTFTNYYYGTRKSSWWIEPESVMEWYIRFINKRPWKCDPNNWKTYFYFPKNDLYDFSYCCIINTKNKDTMKNCSGCLDVCNIQNKRDE